MPEVAVSRRDINPSNINSEDKFANKEKSVRTNINKLKRTLVHILKDFQ
jgi:hypothetical protein